MMYPRINKILGSLFSLCTKINALIPTNDICSYSKNVVQKIRTSTTGAYLIVIHRKRGVIAHCQSARLCTFVICNNMEATQNSPILHKDVISNAKNMNKVHSPFSKVDFF